MKFIKYIFTKNLEVSNNWSNLNFYKSFTKFLTFFLVLCFSTNAFCVSLNFIISGVDEDLQQQILENLSLKALLDENSKELDSERIELLFESSTKEVLQALNSNGYYHAKVDSKLDINDDDYIASYDIILGKPVFIKKVEVKLDTPKYPDSLNKLLTTEKLIIDDILLHKNYEESKDEILAKFIDRGYLKVYFSKHEILIDKDKHAAYINLHIRLGPRYYMGDVIFHSQKYPQYALERYLPFTKGDQYTTKKIERLREILQKTNFFDKVAVRPKPNLENKKNTLVPIDVKLVEKPNKRYSGSIGYLSNIGFKGSLGFLRRHIGDTGHQFSGETTVSKVVKSLNLAYDIPGKKPIYNNYKIIGGLSDERIKDRLSKKGELGAQKIHTKGKVSNILELKYLHELYKIKETDPKTNSSFLLPSFKYTWTDSSKDREFPSGLKFSFFVTGAHKKILSSTNLLKVDLSTIWISKFTENMRLILKAEAGGIFSQDFDKVPLSMRYFTGGDNSIRGFSYKSIGPTEVDENGNFITVGGKYKALASAELEQRIFNNISAAVFLDSGNAMNKWDESYAAGAGAGIRWHSPLGTLRIDVAKPIANRITKNLRFHLTFSKDL